ncbi:hypothetical protein OG21DRAFT_587902 [Imleria badia]|nr:hypothetical protein OG21DRAFT_587902 [Imleria badia]
MERSRKILSKIASASQQVITAANEYADRKDLANVERVHFRLEEEMRKVSIACDSLAGIILMSHGPAIDERPKDWLTSDEPRMCCETLDQMIKLLHEDAPSRTSTSLTVTGITAPEDKINEAVNLFDSREQSFHFLFATDFDAVFDSTRTHPTPERTTSMVNVTFLSKVCDLQFRRASIPISCRRWQYAMADKRMCKGDR